MFIACIDSLILPDILRTSNRLLSESDDQVNNQATTILIKTKIVFNIFTINIQSCNLSQENIQNLKLLIQSHE